MLNFGSLNETLQKSCAAENLARSADADFRTFAAAVPAGGNPFTGASGAVRDLMQSAGPVSDAYILGAEPAMLIIGPGGSGKTVASVKKALVEAQRIFPGPDGVRRYVLGVWRQKYVNLWKATIPSWWSILPKDLPGSRWNGAPPRDATHTLTFEDAHGPIVLTAYFRAFGETADPDDVLGNQYTDCWLNEWPTLPEDLFTALADRVGRDPPMSVIRRPGRFFGDGNAPDVLNYTYRDFYEAEKTGYRLYRQPGGLDPSAENLRAVTRDYYVNSARLNAHRPWWINRMVHARPGFTRANDPVYPAFDDERNRAPGPIEVIRDLPVLVGVDGGLTPAAAYCQERADGQLRIIAEVALERGGMAELATAMLALEQARFRDCEFSTACDPAMGAGEDTADGSDRRRLENHLGRPVRLAATNNTDARWEAVRAKLRHTVDAGLPGLLLDPSCKGLRRGFNQTYAFRPIAGTNDRGSVEKTFDSHVHDALQYAALQCGSAEARRLISAAREQRQERLREAREAGRYNPLRRRSPR